MRVLSSSLCSRSFATLPSDFRLLAHSRPYPLDEPLERIKAMMAAAQDPRAREQIAAYRRFLEQIIHAAYLKDADYYLVLFADGKKSPQALAVSLAAGLRLPVQPVSRFPGLIRSAYREAATHIQPLHPGLPHYAFLYSYDLRGQLSFGTMTAFLQLSCPLSIAVDIKTIHPDKAVRTLQLAYNKLKADLLGEALGGSTLSIAACVALGLAVTTLKVRGLTLYRFVPLAIAFLARKETKDTVEPEEGPSALPQVAVTIRDAEGKPVLYQEK